MSSVRILPDTYSFPFPALYIHVIMRMLEIFSLSLSLSIYIYIYIYNVSTLITDPSGRSDKIFIGMPIIPLTYFCWFDLRQVIK